jgi:hypothetical protein
MTHRYLLYLLRMTLIFPIRTIFPIQILSTHPISPTLLRVPLYLVKAKLIQTILNITSSLFSHFLFLVLKSTFLSALPRRISYSSHVRFMKNLQLLAVKNLKYGLMTCKCIQPRTILNLTRAINEL